MVTLLKGQCAAVSIDPTLPLSICDYLPEMVVLIPIVSRLRLPGHLSQCRRLALCGVAVDSAFWLMLEQAPPCST